MNACIIPSGTVITCPKCEIELCKTIHDIHSTEWTRSVVEGLAWNPTTDQKPICPMCGTYFVGTWEDDARKTVVHTKGGWV